ncbi:MAG: riboflavin synthase [bacterium]|nr:riboflavin synthase [bacterium]
MFTGLVRERGRLIEDPTPSAEGGVRLVLGHSRELGAGLEIGASLAVSGVCLTIVETAPDSSVVELSPETLRRTTLGGLRRDSAVNLEPSLHMGDALGGHWVQGHVDCTTEVVERRDLEAHCEMAFALPPEHRGSVVEKGSIAVDGVSLTVSALETISALTEDRFEVALIPHTLEVTSLGQLGPGDAVNLELDILGKYVQRALVAAGVIPS